MAARVDIAEIRCVMGPVVDVSLVEKPIALDASPQKIRIRKTEDLEVIDELDRRIFADSPRLTDDELEWTDWWIVVLDGRPAGFAGIRLFVSRGQASLTRAGLLPEVRGGGLQKRLIRLRVRFAARKALARCYTYCSSGNVASMRSLIACGFKPYQYVTWPQGQFIYFENRRRVKSQGS